MSGSKDKTIKIWNMITGKRINRLTGHTNRILEGSEQEILAISEFTPGKWLVVAYREFEDDGFIITAYLTRKIRSLNRRRQLWP